jgi:hypothetical protein
VLLVPDACAGSQHLERSLWDFEKGIINVKSIQDTIASLEEAAG